MKEGVVKGREGLWVGEQQEVMHSSNPALKSTFVELLHAGNERETHDSSSSENVNSHDSGDRPGSLVRQGMETKHLGKIFMQAFTWAGGL
jgi:hypothetical protein